MTKAAWSSSRVLDDFPLYGIAAGTVQGYAAVIIALVKPQKVDDGSVVLMMAPAVDVNWRTSVRRKMISNVERDFRRFPGVVDDEDLLADVWADVVEHLTAIFAQVALGKIMVVLPSRMVIV